MLQLKKLLVPVDGSAPSVRATNYSIDLCRLSGAEIVLVHCHRPFPALLGEPYLQAAINKIVEKSNQLLDPYRQLLQAKNTRFQERILQGSPAGVISNTAGLEKCDMIIMGTSGRSSLEGLILGSVAHRVLHSAPCPILLIR